MLKWCGITWCAYLRPSFSPNTHELSRLGCSYVIGGNIELFVMSLPSIGRQWQMHCVDVIHSSTFACMHMCVFIQVWCWSHELCVVSHKQEWVWGQHLQGNWSLRPKPLVLKDTKVAFEAKAIPLSSGLFLRTPSLAIMTTKLLLLILLLA